ALQAHSAELVKRPHGLDARLFGKLATGSAQRFFPPFELAFGNRPRTGLLATPEGPTGVDEQDLRTAFFHAVHQQAGALLRHALAANCGKRAHVNLRGRGEKPRRESRFAARRAGTRSAFIRRERSAKAV